MNFSYYLKILVQHIIKKTYINYFGSYILGTRDLILKPMQKGQETC